MYRRKRRERVIAGIFCVPFVLASTALAVGEPRPDQQQEHQQTKSSNEKQINNSNICKAVRSELNRDHGVPAQEIDISCEDGRVTLKGAVNSLRAKIRAKNLAETVRGVRSVENNINVNPDKKRSASELNKDVRQVLSNDAATRNFSVQAKANDDGKVTLTGNVDSNRKKRLAENVAGSVMGVTSIDNEIEVSQSSRSDDEIRRSAQEALQRNDLVDDRDIDVKVKDQKVMLSGKVASAAEKTQAKTSVWVTGVNDVNADDLKVDSSIRDHKSRSGNTSRRARHNDESIRRSIQAGLIDNPRVFSFDVKPRVSDGHVTLVGTVDNLKAKRAAYTVAMNTSGVKKVDNEVKVRTYPDINDEGLARRIEDAMLINPYVASYQVDVNVKDGVATLTGDVDSYYEKAEADDIAARMTGIRKVNNELDVTHTYYGMTDEPYADDWYVYGYDWYTYPEPEEHESDSEIKDDIQDELWWSPFVDSDDVHVSVKDGVATLTGTVEDMSEFRSAAENAREGGALRVVNDLRIQES